MVWSEWVPSKANPADIPTRADRRHEMPASATWVDLVLPPVEELEGSVAGWIARTREAVAALAP